MHHTIQSLAVGRTRKAARNIIALLDSMPADRLHWSPMEIGQCAADQALECVSVNLKWSRTLLCGIYTRLPAEDVDQIEAGREELGRVKRLLHDSAEELAAAILTIHDDQLDNVIEAPFGTYSVAECCLIGYWNMAYHEGQIGYIQTLYGDLKMRANY